jgi:hypothetical protein
MVISKLAAKAKLLLNTVARLTSKRILLVNMETLRVNLTNEIVRCAIVPA